MATSSRPAIRVPRRTLWPWYCRIRRDGTRWARKVGTVQCVTTSGDRSTPTSSFWKERAACAEERPVSEPLPSEADPVFVEAEFPEPETPGPLEMPRGGFGPVLH